MDYFASLVRSISFTSHTVIQPPTSSTVPSPTTSQTYDPASTYVPVFAPNASSVFSDLAKLVIR
jgi:hypothetical protein